MKPFTKTALSCALVSLAIGTSAATLRLDIGTPHDGSGSGASYDDDVVYEITGLSVDENGRMVVTGAVFDPASLPTGAGNFECGENTTAEDLLDAGGNPGTDGVADTCVGTGPADEPPTVAISINDTTLNAGQTATVSFSFSEAVTGFSSGDVSVSAGSLSGVNGSGSSYTATYTAPTGTTAGSATIQVTGTYVDSASQAGSNSNTLSVSYAAQVDSGGGGTIGDCEVPSHVDVKNSHAIFQNWGTSTSVMETDLSYGRVLSGQVRLGSSTKFHHRVTLWGNYITANMSRKIWLSECPGGDAIMKCAQAGGSQITWYTSQTLTAPPQYCLAGRNKDLYLNIQYMEGQCTSARCGVYMQYTASGTLD